MVFRATVAGLLALVLFSLAAGNASAANNCSGHSYDDKIDASHLWYAQITTCTEIEHEIDIMIWLQDFDWDIWAWTGATFLYSESQFHEDWVASSPTVPRYVAPAGGLHCVRTHAGHLIIDHNPHGPYYVLDSYSPGQCF